MRFKKMIAKILCSAILLTSVNYMSSVTAYAANVTSGDTKLSLKLEKGGFAPSQIGETNLAMDLYKGNTDDTMGETNLAISVSKGIIDSSSFTNIGLTLYNGFAPRQMGDTDLAFEIRNGDTADIGHTILSMTLENGIPSGQFGKMKLSVSLPFGGNVPQPEPSDTSPKTTYNDYNDISVDNGFIKDITEKIDVDKIEGGVIASIKNEESELVNMLGITPAEQEQGVNVWLEVKALEEVEIPEGDKTSIESYLNENKDENLSIGIYLDASLFKKVGNADKQHIEKTNGKILVGFIMPENLRRTDVDFKIIRVHNGVTEVIDAIYDPETNMCYFETDSFSTYAIAFEEKNDGTKDEDTKKQEEKKVKETQDKKNKSDFSKYKTNRINYITKQIKSSDSYNCKKLLADTKKSINSKTYNTKKTLANNKKEIDTIVSKFTKNLKSLRESNNKKKLTLSLNSGLKVSQTKNKVNVSWGKVSNASGYIVYANYCGAKKMNAVKVIKNAKTVSTSFTTLNKKKINTKNNMKIYVAAYKTVKGKKNILCKTITAHIVGCNNKKYTNVKGIKLKKSSYTLKVGKSDTIKGSVVLVDKRKKQLDASHAPTLRFASSDNLIVSVSSKGKIVAKAKGSAIIYVYAKNGFAKKVKVTVK